MSTATPPFTQPRVKKWTKREYFENAERGFFEGQKIFLFRGDLIEMPPQGYLHHFVITELTAWFSKVVGDDARTRTQLPFETPGDSVPEPDAAIVEMAQMKRFPVPNQAILVVEVSDSSMQLDGEKAFEYAGADVPEYWIVDCQNRCVIQHRNVIDDPSALFGKRYTDVKTISDTVSVLMHPDARLEVKKLFP